MQQDAKVQALCRVYAAQYAMHLRCEPPKNIFFLETLAVELVDRPGRPWCAAEKYLEGESTKSGTAILEALVTNGKILHTLSVILLIG
jgi:hypothetical protein